MSEGSGGGALRSLLAFFRISVDSEQLEKADEKIEGFTSKIINLGAAGIWGEAAKKSFDFFKEQVENAAHLQDLSDKLAVSVEDMTAFGFAAQAAGLDVDSASTMLGKLQRTLGGAGKGGAGAAEELKKLGVDAKKAAGKDTIETILDLADGFEKLKTQPEKTAEAIRLFGRQGIAMVPILSKGRAALEAMFEESKELGSGLAGDFYKQSKQAREEFEHFEFAVSSLKERALAAVLPWIIKIGSWLKETAKDVIAYTKHTNILKTGIIFLGAVIAAKLIPALYSAAEALGLLDAETLIPLAAIVLLYLAFDDFYTLMTGGKSVIGDTLDALFGIGTAKQFVVDLTESVDAFIDTVEDVGDLIYSAFVTPFQEAWDVARGLITAIDDLKAGRFKEAFADVKEGVSRAVTRSAKQTERVQRDIGDIGDDLTKSAVYRKVKRNNRRVEEGGPGTMMAPEYGPNTGGTGTRERAAIPGQAQGGKTEKHVDNRQTNHVKIEVNAGNLTEPTETASAIDPVVRRALKDKHNTLTSRNPP